MMSSWFILQKRESGVANQLIKFNLMDSTSQIIVGDTATQANNPDVSQDGRMVIYSKSFNSAHRGPKYGLPILMVQMITKSLAVITSILTSLCGLPMINTLCVRQVLCMILFMAVTRWVQTSGFTMSLRTPHNNC